MQHQSHEIIWSVDGNPVSATIKTPFGTYENLLTTDDILTAFITICETITCSIAEVQATIQQIERALAQEQYNTLNSIPH